jgi:hypothetical protein
MSAQRQEAVPANSFFTPVRGRLLQRKCACGGTPGLTGECEECRKKKLQRKVCDSEAATQPPTFNSQPFAVPPIVHEVLRSPGQPLDAATRRIMEPRFGHDFSQVRVHSGRAAEQSARDVNANAYTVGHNVVFGTGRLAPGTHEGRRLIAHELTHVVQQSRSRNSAARLDYSSAEAEADHAAAHAVQFGAQISELGSAPLGLARSPVEPVKSAEEVKKLHKVDLDHLKEVLTTLLHSLSPATQARIDRNSTVAVALVEMIDEKNNPFTTLVYATNTNANTPELEAAADRLGIQHIGGAVPRAEGRGETGAPGDAEQLLREAASENDMEIVAQAVSRPPCKDCAVMIKEEEVRTVWLDRAARKTAFGAGRLLRKGSADLKKALAEIDLAFSPALTAPGEEAQTGLGSDAPVWRTLNSLEISELYQVFGLMQQQGRLNRFYQAAPKARGIYNDRLLAVMAALYYKKELQSASPTDSALLGAHWAFSTAAVDLPTDQLAFLQRALQPSLRSILKKQRPRTTETKSTKPQPKKETADPKKSTDTRFGEAVTKGLKAAGVVVSGLVLLELAEAIASALFVEVVLASAAQVLKGAATDKAKEVVVNELRKRVATSPEQLRRIGDSVIHELEPILETVERALVR